MIFSEICWDFSLVYNSTLAAKMCVHFNFFPCPMIIQCLISQLWQLNTVLKFNMNYVNSYPYFSSFYFWVKPKGLVKIVFLDYFPYRTITWLSFHFFLLRRLQVRWRVIWGHVDTGHHSRKSRTRWKETWSLTPGRLRASKTFLVLGWIIPNSLST